MRLKIVAVSVLLIGCLMGCSKQAEPKDIKTLEYSKVFFNVDEDLYYPIRIPNELQYVTDNAKYIYADDEKLNVSVLSGVDRYNFSETTLVGKTETLQENLVVTKDWQKQDTMEAALYLTNGKAVRVHVEDNINAFATILEGLTKESLKESSYKGLKVTEDTVVKKLPSYQGEPEVQGGLGGQLRKVYALRDGYSSLSISQELRKYDDAIELYEKRIATIADSSVASYYVKTDDMFYAEVGDYVVGIYKVNFNTVVTCYGFGDAAKLNTVFFMLNQGD